EVRARVLAVGKIVHRLSHRFARAHELAFGDGGGLVAELREEVAAEERARGNLAEEAAIPAMRRVRRVEPRDGVRAELETLAVTERFRRALGDVRREDDGADLAGERHRSRRYGEPLVDGPAFVGFRVGEPDVTERLGRQHLAYGF